jgi:hypothetical protein
MSTMLSYHRVVVVVDERENRNIANPHALDIAVIVFSSPSPLFFSHSTNLSLFFVEGGRGEECSISLDGGARRAEAFSSPKTITMSERKSSVLRFCRTLFYPYF